MELFSSNAESTINKTVQCDTEVLPIKSETDLVNFFNLEKCFEFIDENKFSKVCLQFPDSLLEFSVQVALWLERHINQKVYVLGDTTYGSCCVDELAAEHVGADAVIHMGHACLSPTSRLPVLYVFPRTSLDVAHFVSAFENFANESSGTILLLYDVSYNHLVSQLREVLAQYSSRLVISQLCLPENQPCPCGETCELRKDGGEKSSHKVKLLGHTFCCECPSSVVYIAHKQLQTAVNFALSFRDAKLFVYSKDCQSGTLDFNKTLRKRFFLLEKVKDAKTLGIIVGTLSVDKFLDAIERVKALAAYRGKRCYIFSVGKPNPAKLANFPEIEVFVLLSCPEACLENEKEYFQPVVTLLEVELALNPDRKWDDKLSVDFRDFVEGGPHFTPLLKGQSPLEADVSLVSNRIRSDVVACEDESGTGNELSVREHYQISLASSYSSTRSWRGLEQALGETPINEVTKGRSGIPLGYEEEKLHTTKPL